MKTLGNKGFCKLELLILILILCTAAFIAVPIYNSYLEAKNLNEIDSLSEEFTDRNQSVESNNSEIPVQVLIVD
jgi:Tfp pilus assembly protein PilE